MARNSTVHVDNGVALLSSRRVVIIGAGFAGAFTAKNLQRRFGDDVEIELINSTNYFVFQPLLPEVAAGIINSSDAVTPLRVMVPGVKFRMAEVTGVNFAAREVDLVQGSRRVPISVPYDHLVFAAGQRGNLDMLPGFSDHSITIKNLADAHRLRNHVIQCLEHADITKDALLKKRLLTFVIAGGGFSGIETAGELTEMVRRTLHHYPDIDQSEIRVTVIQRDTRILTELPEKLSAYAHRKLEQRGVEILVGTGIQAASRTNVFLVDNTAIETSTLVATIGSGPTRLVERLPLELSRGKIVTDRCFRVAGHESVWAVGDCAAIPLDEEGSSFAPPTAQFATAESAQLAENIVRVEQGSEPVAFEFQAKGALASIGRYSAVAQLFGVNVSGLLAWFLWRGFYILRIPGFATKMRVTLNWFFDYLLPRQIVQVRGDEPVATRYATYKKGDVIFREHQIPDGLYTVASGLLESRIEDREGGGVHVRQLGPGDHWGELSLSHEWLTIGTLTAIEDSRVLVFQREDFNRLRQTLPVVERYFEGLTHERYGPALRSRSDEQN